MNEKRIPALRQRKDARNENVKSDKVPTSGALAYLHDFVWLLLFLGIAFLICFRAVIVSGPSMRTTLLDGDYLLLSARIFYNDPQQGDIVVISKDEYRDGEPIVKRIIATEGQTVDIDFVRGVVYVDGVALDEPYTLTPTNLQEGVIFPITVAENCVFVMGDNRNESKDSRSHEIGLADERQILGKALFLIFPGTDGERVARDFSRIGALS